VTVRSALGTGVVLVVTLAVVLAPVSGVAVPPGDASGVTATIGDHDDGGSTTVVERTLSDGTVYQSGRITSAPDSVDPPAQPVVTAEITAEIDEADDNIVYAVVGYADGTPLQTTRMDGLGSGTVTTGVQVREDPRGTHLVWTFYAVRTAAEATDAFQREASRNQFVDGDSGIVFASFDGSGSGGDGTGGSGNETGGDGDESDGSESGNETSAVDAGFTLDRSGSVVQVQATTSSAEGEIASYEWDFGDGTTDTGLSTEHVYDESGTYEISLTVTDEQGRNDTATRSVEIGADSGDDTDSGDGSGDENESDGAGRPDLRAIAYGETETGYVDEGDAFESGYLDGFRYEPVTFTGAAGDLVALDVDTAEPGRYMSANVYGPSGELERQENGAYVLPADGEYTIRAGFLGSAPGEYDLTLTRLGGEAPAVTFDVADDPGVNVETSFEATISGDDTVETVVWDFGDATTATGAEVSHTYREPGDYTVEVTVTDAQGDTANASQVVTVESELRARYDTDDDGLDMDELDEAMSDITNESRGGDVEFSVEDVREAIEEYAANRGVAPPDDDGSGNVTEDSDGDGLPDSLEEQGIPVPAESVYNLSAAGENANVTDKDGPPGVVYLKTDPNKADTDGDGLNDSEELGEKRDIHTTADPDDFVYTVVTDPTDPDTDDAGLNDEAELKAGSNPRVPEYLSVNAIVPVFARQGCDPGEPPNPTNCIDGSLRGDDADAGVKVVDEFNKNSGNDADDQVWLEEIAEDKIENGRTYYLISVTVSGEAKNIPESVRSDVGVVFTGFSHYSTTLIGAGPGSKENVDDSWLFEPWEDGRDGEMTAYLVVRSQYERDDPLWQDLGRLSMDVQIPNSPYTRDEHDRYSGGTVTSETSFAVKDGLPLTSGEEARELVAEGTRKFAKGVVSATFPATAGGIGAQAFYHLTGRAAAATLVTAEGACLFTGIDNKGLGPDDMVGAHYAGQGAVPTYLENGNERPTTGFVMTVHRAN
jgi:PKD repeat protein